MAFLTEATKALRSTVIYLRTAISMARSENAFQNLDSRIKNLEEYEKALFDVKTLAHVEEAEEYINSIADMLVEVESMLAAAKKKRKKRGSTPYS